MKRAPLWPTSLLLGAMALSGPSACSSDEPAPESGGSSNVDAGIDLEDIDLAVYPLRQYTGFDGTHAFQIPFSVFRAQDDLTVEASDPTAVDIVAASYDAAKADGRYFLITPKKPGELTLTARSRGKSVSSTLTVTEYAASRFDVGKARYENESPTGERACASCHQKPDGADHSPAAISAAADDAVKAVIRTGVDLGNSPIRGVEHRWKADAATLDGLVTYLRALPPRGYVAGAQSRSQQLGTWAPRYRADGLLRHARALVPRPVDAPLSYVQHTRNVLKANPSWLGTLDPERSLALQTERVDRLGQRRLRFAQVERGVPVLGHELAAHFDADGTLRTLDSTLVDGLHDLDLTPRIDTQAAEQVVVAELARRYGRDPAHARLGFEAWGEARTTPQLAIDTHAGRRRPCWLVGLAIDAGGPPLRLRARVDAHTGALLEMYDDVKTITATGNGVFDDERSFEVSPTRTGFELVDATRGDGIVTHTALEDFDLPGDIVSAATKDATWDRSVPNGKGSAVDAHFFAGVVYDFYASTFERRGIDGNDGAIHSTVHYGLRYENAFWDGLQMAYGDGDRFKPFAGALDIVAHELTHGITQNESQLEYSFQSGALNEAISDIFGAAIEHQLAPEANGNWLIGEAIGVADVPLRSMIDPSKAEVPQPQHMREYLDLTLDQDNGGVHLNSGIVNHAAYLMTVGGTHRLSKITVPGGLGWAKMAQLWYRVNTEYLLRQSEFVDCAEATLDAAADLGFSAAERETISCAWTAVGVLSSGCASATPTPAPQPSATTDAGSATGATPGSTTKGRGDENADFDQRASACQASPGSASAPWALTLLAAMAARRARRAPHARTKARR